MAARRSPICKGEEEEERRRWMSEVEIGRRVTPPSREGFLN